MVSLTTVTTQAQTDSTALANDSIKWEKMLGEVTVKGHRNIVKVKGNSLMAHIANTELSQLGTANDVLSRLLFVNMDGDEINIMGKGKPVVFIDNRQVCDDSELQLLKSEDIKDIQIVTSPGAEYGSDVKAVIKIRLKQSFIKGLSGKFTSQTSAKRIWEETAMADLSYNWTHWQLFGQAMYNNGGRKNYDTSTTNFVFGNQGNKLVNIGQKRNKLATTSAKGGLNYNNGGQSFGGYYQYTNSPAHFKSRGTENDIVLDTENDNINKLIDTDSKSERHLATAYYDGTFKNGSTLHFDGNYMHTWYADENLTQTLYTSGNGDEIVPSQTEMGSNLWAGKLYYEFPVGTGKLNFGTEDSYTYNSQRYTMKNDDVSSYIPSTENESRQYNYAAFATYSKAWQSLSLQIGIRWEYVKFKYERDGVRDDDVSKTNNSFSPSISLSYNINESTFMALDYSSSVIRPPYKQLRSSLLYVGPYEVEGGNPMLSDCMMNTLNYLFGWHDLTFEFSYSHLEDTYAYTKEHYASDSPILIFSPVQTDISYVNAYISYAPVVKFWKPNFTVGMDKQWLTLYGEKYGKPMFRYMLKNIFNPGKHWLFTFDITGSTRGHSMTNEMRSSWGIDLSARRYFLQKHLQISLSANDIFHTRNQSWIMNVKDVSLMKDSDADTRRVTLTLSYTFNPKKSLYKGKAASEKEMKRL